MCGPEAGKEADDCYQHALHYRDGSSAESAADHDLQARDGSDEAFFEEAELAVPQEAETREDGGEEYGHSDDARGDELQIAAVSGTLKDGSKAETEDEKVQHGLAQ